MTRCFFVTDIHGRTDRYLKLFQAVRREKPDMVFLGGDLLPHGLHRSVLDDFTNDFLAPELMILKKELGSAYPEIGVILGNDDPRGEEEVFLEYEKKGLWHYLNQRKKELAGYTFYGYAFVPPTPFRYKDWERYDVSRYVDPGCIAPEEGIRTVDTDVDITVMTIWEDLQNLAGDDGMDKAVFLFHSPPYKTCLDRAALDGKMIEHVPLDVHVGSIAISRFIEERQPVLTMHGHIHESTRLTGQWKQTFDRTHAFNAAWDGPELCLIDFDLEDPGKAEWSLI